MDSYWRTDQLIHCFNKHYCKNFDHEWKVTCDEHIFWGFMRNQPGEGYLCARKPRGFGPEHKCLSAVGINVSTTFEHVCNA
eukprot:7932312-Ditylum_brightwellii.AAC.1